jgi:hypothetical protein
VDRRIPEGQRDDTLTSLAGSMRRRGMPEQAILAALMVVNVEQCDPPLSASQVEKIAKSVASHPPSEQGAGQDAYAIILGYFRQKYRPVFRRGTVLYSEALGREVKMGEACCAAGKALLEQLGGAANAPRYQDGVVKFNDLPRMFHTWAKSAWVDLLDELPEEAKAEEVSPFAEAEFRELVADALLTFRSFGHNRKNEKGEDRIVVESRTLLNWCELWAKPGRWQSVRGLMLWTRRDSQGHLCIALNARLFGQIGHGTDRLTQDTLGNLSTRYDVGVRQKAGGSRAVELLPAFIAELQAQPEFVDELAEDGRELGHPNVSCPVVHSSTSDEMGLE